MRATHAEDLRCGVAVGHGAGGGLQALLGVAHGTVETPLCVGVGVGFSLLSLLSLRRTRLQTLLHHPPRTCARRSVSLQLAGRRS
jgi:hypothetical protein